MSDGPSAVIDAPIPGHCCGSRRRLTMSDYIDRGLRRSRSPVLPVVGAACEDDDGRFARFSLQVEGDVISDVRFQASPCVTLVAYCEVAAEWVTGQTLPAAARRIRAADLSSELPLVPAAKRARALLASQALIASIVAGARNTKDTKGHEGHEGHEGREVEFIGTQ
jgi:hypothetical protein